MKQWMSQQWDQGRNQKIPWNKWKWGHNNPKLVGHWESNPQMEIHNITGLSQKTRKSLNKQSNFTHKRTRKRTKKAQSELKGENNKDQSRKKWNRDLKKSIKDRLIQELDLWKDKLDWQYFNQSHQEKGRGPK